MLRFVVRNTFSVALKPHTMEKKAVVVNKADTKVASNRNIG